MHGYNGYTNKSTYTVSLWLNNDVQLYNWVNSNKDIYNTSLKLADFIKDIITEEFEKNIIEYCNEHTNSLMHDLLNNCLSEINWIEIAECFL